LISVSEQWGHKADWHPEQQWRCRSGSVPEGKVGTVQPSDYGGAGQAVWRQLGYEDVTNSNSFVNMP